LTADGLSWYNTSAVGVTAAPVIASGSGKAPRLYSSRAKAKDAPKQGQAPLLARQSSLEYREFDK